MTVERQEFEGTIDWNGYWKNWSEEKTEAYPASVSGGHYERVIRFFEQVGVPDDAAFVGCGPGALAAKVASTYPTMEVVGYDAAASVIERNREKYATLANVVFEQEILPAFDVNRQFDFVLCYGTLHYVQEITRAIENLNAHVRQGGHLVFNYPNEAYQNNHQDAEGQLRERLQLPINGENLLSREQIADAFNADIRDFWETVEADGPFVRPANPCVIVDK